VNLLRRFIIDFIIGAIVLPLATWAAVWFSFQILNIGAWAGPLWAPLGLLIFFGPLLWLPIFYGGALVWVLRPAFRGHFGRAAATVLCLAGWAGYAGYQSVQAQTEARKIAETSNQIRPIAGIDAVAFADTTVCDADCTELLAGGFVKTIYLERGSTTTHVLTLTRDSPCEGPSALASKILRDNNRFDLCINDTVAPHYTADGLLFQKSSEYARNFYGLHRSLTIFNVSRWVDNHWAPIFQRKYGHIYVLQYFPVFISGFTDTGWIGTDWWRRAIKVGEPVDMKDVINATLGIKLTGAFNPYTVQRQGSGTISRLKTPPPAPPAALAANLERMSTDSDPAVRRQAAAGIKRFMAENKTYEPIRATLERLFADPDSQVKASAYEAIAYLPIAIDDKLLKSIMASADWQASALGNLLARLSEDQVRPYQAQIITAYFDTEHVDDHLHGFDRPDDKLAGDRAVRSAQAAARKSRETLASAVTGLPIEGLKQIFDRCPEITDAALSEMGALIDSDQRRMSNAILLKLKATWAPCALQRMTAFNPYAITRTARGLAWIGNGPAAAAEIEKRLAAPMPSDTDIDKSNLHGVLAWLHRFEGDFQKRWADSTAQQR
jgi:hypothetical protein